MFPRPYPWCSRHTTSNLGSRPNPRDVTSFDRWIELNGLTREDGPRSTLPGMTDDRPGGASGRQQFSARLLITVGTLAIIGGAVAIVVGKTAADQALTAGSSGAVLAVGVNSGYLFPAPGPDYTGVWIGLAAVVAGIAALIIGLISAYRRHHSI